MTRTLHTSVAAFVSRYPKPSGLGLSSHARKRGFSPWGMLFGPNQNSMHEAIA
jgi:hypothetical protein